MGWPDSETNYKLQICCEEIPIIMYILTVEYVRYIYICVWCSGKTMHIDKIIKMLFYC